MKGAVLATDAPSTGETWRVRPSIGVAVAVFVAYTVAFIGLSATSTAPYDEWFATGANAWRSAVLPLAAGIVVLVAFLAWARWDHVFRDPERLWMSRALQVPLILFGLGIVIHFVLVDWGSVGTNLLVPVVLAGVGVGFAEETMFRGVILRALRSAGRPEVFVALVSSVWFGFFHLTNVVNGAPVGGTITQCVLASFAGLVLYLFRRRSASLLPAMVAHGLWDISVFLPTTDVGSLVSLLLQVAIAIAALVAAVVLLRNRAPGIEASGVTATAG